MVHIKRGPDQKMILVKEQTLTEQEKQQFVEGVFAFKVDPQKRNEESCRVLHPKDTDRSPSVPVMIEKGLYMEVITASDGLPYDGDQTLQGFKFPRKKPVLDLI